MVNAKTHYSACGNGHGNGHTNGHPHPSQKPQQHDAPQSPPSGAAAANGTAAAQSPNPKPYFLSPEISIDMFPRQLRSAILEIVQPCYVELVLDAHNALERQAGATLR